MTNTIRAELNGKAPAGYPEWVMYYPSVPAWARRTHAFLQWAYYRNGRKGARGAKTLARYMGCRPQTVGPILKRMEAEGLARRVNQRWEAVTWKTGRQFAQLPYWVLFANVKGKGRVRLISATELDIVAAVILRAGKPTPVARLMEMTGFSRRQVIYSLEALLRPAKTCDGLPISGYTVLVRSRRKGDRAYRYELGRAPSPNDRRAPHGFPRTAYGCAQRFARESAHQADGHEYYADLTFPGVKRAAAKFKEWNPDGDYTEEMKNIGQFFYGQEVRDNGLVFTGILLGDNPVGWRKYCEQFHPES